MIETIGVVLLVGFSLALISLMDIKTKTVPSFITTSVILALCFYRLVLSPMHLFFGIMAFIFGWLLYELDYIRGVADLKVLIIIGLMLTTIKQFFFFMVLTGLIGLIYQVIVLKIIKIKEGREIPFLPALFCVYLILMLLIFLT